MDQVLSIFHYFINMNIHMESWGLNSGKYIYVTDLYKFFLDSNNFDWQNQSLFSENSFSEELTSDWLLTLYVTNFSDENKQAAFIRMKLRILVRTNYGGKLPVSIKCCNHHSFIWFSSPYNPFEGSNCNESPLRCWKEMALTWLQFFKINALKSSVKILGFCPKFVEGFFPEKVSDALAIVNPWFKSEQYW